MSREDSGSLTKARQEELRTIKTEDIDVELSSKDTNRDHAIPGTKHIFALRLETLCAGGVRLGCNKRPKTPFVVQMYIFGVWYVYLQTVLSTIVITYIISTASNANIL